MVLCYLVLKQPPLAAASQLHLMSLLQSLLLRLLWWLLRRPLLLLLLHLLPLRGFPQLFLQLRLREKCWIVKLHGDLSPSLLVPRLCFRHQDRKSVV